MSPNILRSFLTVQVLTIIEILFSSKLLYESKKSIIGEDFSLIAALFIVSFGLINVIGQTILIDVIPDTQTRNVLIGASLGLVSAYIKNKVAMPYFIYGFNNPRSIYIISVILYVLVYTQFITGYVDTNLCT